MVTHRRGYISTPDCYPRPKAWIDTPTYQEECAYLAAHRELLEPAADGAVEEALLMVTTDQAERHRGLRREERADDVPAAYRPLPMRLLAHEFVAADPDGQLRLLAERAGDLQTGTVREVCEALAAEPDGDDDATPADPALRLRGLRAAALLDLAALHAHQPALDALRADGGADSWSDLLQLHATAPDGRALRPTAVVAWTAARARPAAATAMFYLAIATALQGDPTTAADLVREARGTDDARAPEWLARCAAIAQQHPAVLPLLTALTEPHPGPAEPDPGP